MGTKTPIHQITDEMREAAAARKCYACGCFQGALTQLSDALPALSRPDREHLEPVLREGSDRVVPQKYDCLGCDVCWPANALNVAANAFPEAGSGDACPTHTPSHRQMWPPLPGSYEILDSGGHVAVCVLTSESLIDALISARPTHVAIVGTLFTENLGIERVITNVLANPNLTTRVVSGADSRQRIGHRPGQSLLSLMAHGLDGRGRIREAKGRRPVLRNLPPETVQAFRSGITLIDRLGEERPQALLEALAALPPPTGPRRALAPTVHGPNVIPAESVQRLVLDPEGYFILFPDRNRNAILVEHYTNDGTLAHVLTGTTAQELYVTVVARKLVSRLDHAAYLGVEFARVERALTTGEPYVQDQAAEPPCSTGCGCGSSAKSRGA